MYQSLPFIWCARSPVNRRKTAVLVPAAKKLIVVLLVAVILNKIRNHSVILLILLLLLLLLIIYPPQNRRLYLLLPLVVNELHRRLDDVSVQRQKHTLGSIWEDVLFKSRQIRFVVWSGAGGIRVVIEMTVKGNVR